MRKFIFVNNNNNNNNNNMIKKLNIKLINPQICGQTVVVIGGNNDDQITLTNKLTKEIECISFFFYDPTTTIKKEEESLTTYVDCDPDILFNSLEYRIRLHVIDYRSGKKALDKLFPIGRHYKLLYIRCINNYLDLKACRGNLNWIFIHNTVEDLEQLHKEYISEMNYSEFQDLVFSIDTRFFVIHVKYNNITFYKYE